MDEYGHYLVHRQQHDRAAARRPDPATLPRGAARSRGRHALARRMREVADRLDG